MARRRLRQGFTTGSAAAAAAKAALLLLLTGKAPDTIDTPLPVEGRLAIPLEQALATGPDTAVAAVVKDGGDDPDATHGARILCQVRLAPTGIRIEGGRGVGRVTLPGLALAPGRAAINPDPLRQIASAAAEAMAEAGYQGGAELTVEVENGEEIAKKTLNPRLGIVGGVSILGTTGIVKPFSHDAWKATIDGGLKVARAMGLTRAALCTGRKSERYVQRELPGLPEQAFVQIADHFAYSLAGAAALGFNRLTLACFCGKLVKMALGYPYTHAGSGAVDFATLSGWLTEAGTPAAIAAKATSAVTARGVLELLADDPSLPAVLDLLCQKALAQARRHAGPDPALDIVVFDFDGRLLASASRGD